MEFFIFQAIKKLKTPFRITIKRTLSEIRRKAH